MKKILVTGGCGFIGSNYILRVLDQHPDVTVVNLDILTYAGNPENLLSVSGNPRYVFVKGSICDEAVVNRVFAEHDVDGVIHFAAESHVDRSITGPGVFIDTNVRGTQNLLEAARRTWEGKFDRKRFVHVSTDEVYGALGDTGLFSEDTPLAPNSPYSASKAGSDLIARAYFHTYGFPVCTTRCSNNYGPYQFPEKLIPLMIVNALHDKPLPVYGDGLYTRDWLYVVDHCDAIDTVYHKGVNGEVYNIGGNNEKRNIEIVTLILSGLNKPESLIKYVKDRPGHDRRYAIDASKIKRDLGWSPAMTFEKGMQLTIKWYLENEGWWRKLLK